MHLALGGRAQDQICSQNNLGSFLIFYIRGGLKKTARVMGNFCSGSIAAFIVCVARGVKSMIF